MKDIHSQDQTDYGVLNALIGTWYGESGVDVSPEEATDETHHYREEMIFEPVRDVDNAEEQELVALRYRQTVIRIRDEKLIHAETGFYSWDSENKLLVKSLSIPRGLSLVAGGSVETQDDETVFKVVSAKGHQDWGIVEAPFLQQNATMHTYDFEMSLNGDCLRYFQSMRISIYGREVEHTDRNTLKRIS